jgi:hypothetical protein
MSRQTAPYQRGKFWLEPRNGRNFDIVWYDTGRSRNRSISSGSKDVREASLALDREYLKSEGHSTCPTCHRTWDGQAPALALDAIVDYLILSEGKAGIVSSRTRLSHVVRYLELKPDTSCVEIDERWIEGFRQWRLKQKYKGQPPSLSHVEGSVMQLAAAITATQTLPAKFKARQMASLSQSPEHRSDVQELAAMFDYALAYDIRDNLLRFLRAAVATWARPDAIYDIHSNNWRAKARVLHLNPANRPQTKKYRPVIPVAPQFAVILDELEGNYIPVNNIIHQWSKMQTELKLPKGREAGQKLIRRSMATIARRELGEADWIQGRIMLGHVKSTTSDIYALPNPAQIGRALAVTESIISDIEKLCPNAFHRTFTAEIFDFGQFKRAKTG